MDRKSILVLAASVILMILGPMVVNRIFPPIPIDPNSTNAVATAAIPQPRVDGTNLPLSSPTLQPTPAVTPVPTGPEQTITLENDYLRGVLSSAGGGLKLLELKRYPASVDRQAQQTTETNRLAALNAGAPRSALSLAGPLELVGDGSYTLSRTATGARAQKDLPTGLRIIKEVQLTTNYQLSATIRFENLTNQPLVLPGHELVIGTSTPMGDKDESLTMGMIWHDGGKAERINSAWFANMTLGCIPGTPRVEYRQGSSNAVWAAVQNQFFTLITVPAEKAPEVVGRSVRLPAPSADRQAGDRRVVKDPHGQEAAFGYPQTVLSAGQSLERSYEIYAGPKEYYTLSRLPKHQDAVMGFDGWFGPFAKGLLLSMNGLNHWLGMGYGWAIILITIIIKLLFWPLTNASTRSMKRMAELQPQMKALQEKHKDDPAKMNKKLMEFMKENKVSPLGGCLPMLLQIPVFIGFYNMLQSAIELRGAEFLWVHDLSQSDTIFMIPGVHFPVNPMPIMMGVTMFFQARMTPPSPGMDPTQQKIMKYMPMMFVVFLYSFSAGLTLYWTVQNLLTIAQMKITKTKPVQSSTPGAASAGAVKIIKPRKRTP